MKRTINLQDIKLPSGYRIDVIEKDLTTPISLALTDYNEILIGDAGITSGGGKVYLPNTGEVWKVIKL